VHPLGRAYISRDFSWISATHTSLRAGWRMRGSRPAGLLALTREQGHRGHETYALRLLGEIASRGDPLDAETAEGYYRQALALATELEMRPLVAHCHLGLGKLYRRTGDHAKASEHLTTAKAMYREMDMGFWLEKADTAATGDDP
jgi:hypothetical protein